MRPDFEPAVFIEIIVVLVVVQRVFIAVDRGVEQVEQPADFFPVGFVAFAVQKILDRLVALYREEGVKARDIHRDVVQRHRDAAVFDALPHRGVVGFQLGLRAGIAAARGFERVGGFGCGGGGGGKETDLPAQHFQQRRPGRKDGGSAGTDGGRSHRQRADGLAARAPCFGQSVHGADSLPWRRGWRGQAGLFTGAGQNPPGLVVGQRAVGHRQSAEFPPDGVLRG